MSGAGTGCSVTVLRAVGNAQATKRFIWSAALGEWRKISYQAGAWFIPAEYPVADLAGLVAVVERARRDPQAFLVRGALSPDAAQAVAANPQHRIRRRKHLKGGIEPTLVEVPRRWIMLDIDNWPLPDWADLADDPDTIIDGAIHALLPAEFHEAECWWQLSASCGFVRGFLKVHLFFWLSEPTTNAHLKMVFGQHAPGIDRAPFSAAQPHFIADPIIEEGHDPLPRRTGWRKGLEPAVTLPALLPQVSKPRPAGTGATGRPGGIADALAYLGHGKGGEGFHDPLRTAIWRYARQCNRTGQRDDEAVKAELRAAIRAAPCRPGGDVEQPYCQDYYLQTSIDGAFAVLAGDPEIQSMRPHHEPAADTLADARSAVGEHIAGFFDRAAAWNALDKAARTASPAEHAALIVDVGTGKSTRARAALPAFIRAAKAAGRPCRVLWFNPTHRLGDEALADMERLDINAAIWRGRDAVDPDTIDPDGEAPPQKMCLNMEAVEDALSIHANVETSVCGTEDGPRCPWRCSDDRGVEQCGFQRQKAKVARADVVIAAHQNMFYELPKPIRSNLAAVIVDESWWQAGLLPHRDVRLAGFAQEPLTHPVYDRQPVSGSGKVYRQVANDLDTNELHAASAKAQQAFEATAEGELVSRASLRAVGLTAGECASAYALEWRRMFEGAIFPGQSPAARREMMLAAAHNAVIPRRAAIWRALLALLTGEETCTGRLQLGSRATAEGSYRTIILHTRLEVRAEIAALPMLHLDATMPLDINRYYLPRLTLLAEVRPVTPHMHVHQIIGGWGKTSLVPSHKATPEENRRRANRVAELADFAALHSAANGVVITYFDIEEAFRRDGIRTAHFNAIAGLDAFKDATSLCVIGRPLPDAQELRVLALALTGRAVPIEAGHYETRGAPMRHGTGGALNVRAFYDPDLEALRVAITEAEIIQCVGRGRGVNRTADNPLTVFLFADVATPLAITSMRRWPDVRPGVLARMASRGVMLLSPTDASRVYPDLFPTAGAARLAIGRDLATRPQAYIPLRYYLSLGECTLVVPLKVQYRPEGERMKQRQAWVAESRLKTLKAWLSERLGVLVHILTADAATPPAQPTKPEPEITASGVEQERLPPEMFFPVLQEEDEHHYEDRRSLATVLAEVGLRLRGRTPPDDEWQPHCLPATLPTFVVRGVAAVATAHGRAFGSAVGHASAAGPDLEASSA